MNRRLRSLALAAWCGWACQLAPVRVSAETTASQRATAEALFQQATALLEQKRFAEACEKLSSSHDLDPALGTMLYLADCYEQSGKTASAWALFREAAEKSKLAGQGEREQIASERAASLEKRLSQLTIVVPPAVRVPGLELTVNGAPVPSASWNGPLPLDPGGTRVEARAPGKKPWSTRLTVSTGPVMQTLQVPRLADAPRVAPLVEPSSAARGSSQRTIGYVLGAAGVVALAVGGVLGYRAYRLDKDSRGDCRADEPNACTPKGVEQREDAKAAAALSTIATLGGAGLTVTGLALVVTAPSQPESPDAAPRRVANVTLSLSGTW
jgi:tetratricopeptide (TPR) repeat protein